MAIGLVKDTGSVFIEKEVTEGTYVPEQAAASAVAVLSDGLEFTPTKELIERNNRTNTTETVVGRSSTRSMSGTIPTEFKASATEGGEPETSPLYESLLGGKDTLVARTSLTGHTTTKIFLTAGEELQYKVGHIVKVKQYDAAATADHISPIASVDSTLGIESITLLVPYTAAFTDNVEIGAATNYYPKDGAPTLSVSNYHGGEILEKAIGMRCAGLEISGFSTGALPESAFTLEGLDFDRVVQQPLFTPSFDEELGAEPPIVLCAKVFKDATEIVVNAVTVSLTNTIGFLTSTASKSGKIKSRITKFAAGFTIDPYMEDNNTDLFDLFKDNTGFSIFGSAANFGASEDEKLQNIAYYLPNCRIPEITTADLEGIISESINGTAHRLLGNDTCFIAFL